MAETEKEDVVSAGAGKDGGEAADVSAAAGVRTLKPSILGIKRNVFFLGIISLLNDIASEIIYPLAPIFLKTVLGPAYAVFIGLIEGIAEGTASLMKLLSGWYSDRIRRNKAFVFVGYTFSVLFRPLIGLALAWWHVLFVRVADRVGKGVRTAPRDALIASSITDDERGKSFGFHRAMDHLGAVLGGLLAFALVWMFALRDSPEELWKVFLFAFVPGLASLYFVVWKIKERAAERRPSQPVIEDVRPEAEASAKSPALDGRLKLFLLIFALFTLGNSSDMFLLLRLGEIEDFWWKVPLVWAVFHVVKSAFSTPAGMISDKVGRKAVIVAGWIIYSGVYFGFAFTSTTNAMWILFMIYGVYYALTEGVAKAMVADLAPGDRLGTAFGWYHATVGFAIIPASIIFGALWYGFGSYAYPFCLGAVLALAAAVLLIIFVPGGREPSVEGNGVLVLEPVDVKEVPSIPPIEDGGDADLGLTQDVGPSEEEV